MLLLYHTKLDSARGRGVIIFFFVRWQGTPYKFIMDIIKFWMPPIRKHTYPEFWGHVCLLAVE